MTTMNLKLKAALTIAVCILAFQVSWSPGESADARFIDNGDQTLTDSKTGLMWMKNDSYLHTGHWFSWFEAQDFIKELNEETFAGHMDWRAPTVKELISIYEPDKTNSAQVGREMKIHIDPLFGKEGAGSMWSSESNGRFNAFGVVFNTGVRFNGPKKSKARKAVRAVRPASP